MVGQRDLWWLELAKGTLGGYRPAAAQSHRWLGMRRTEERNLPAGAGLHIEVRHAIVVYKPALLLPYPR